VGAGVSGWGGEGRNRSYTTPRKFFGFGNFSFIYPCGDIRERHGPHCKQRTDEIAVLCAGSSRVCQENLGLCKIWELTVHDETRSSNLGKEKCSVHQYPPKETSSHQMVYGK